MYSETIFVNPLVLGIGGVAKVGKDTFLTKLAEKLNVPVVCFKFAHQLRADLNLRLGDWLGVDFFTQDPATKELLRPIMVYSAEFLRKDTRGLYFVNHLADSMQGYTSKTIKTIRLGQQEFDFKNPLAKTPVDAIFAVTDLRFAEFEFDEIDFINANGISVHLSRSGVQPNNPVEERNESVLRSKCKIQLDIPTLDRQLEYERNLDYVVSEILSYKS